MPTYTVKDPQSGRTVKLTGDSPPTEAELADIFAKLPAAGPPAAAIAGMQPQSTTTSPAEGVWTDRPGGGMEYHAPAGAGDVADRPDRAVIRIGGVGIAPEDLLALKGALPAFRAAKPVLFPTRAAAGAKFEQVMSKAQNVPVDISAPGNVAFRIKELADRGAQMPLVVRKLLKRMVDPEQGPMAYREARDWASNVSRMSANEMGRLSPKVGAEVHKLRVALNAAVGEAAGTVGEGGTYQAAMKEFAKASARAAMAKKVKKEAIKGLAYGAGAGAAGAAAYRIFSGD